jgi:hypothetical protein
MIADRYTKAVLTVIAAALSLIAARPWLPDTGWVSALRPQPAHAQTMVPKYKVTVPKAWGKFLGFSDNNLLLESPDQTLRVVGLEGKTPEFPKIKVLIHWQ